MSCMNVLLISYSFPPAGGVGVLRAASLARYFPAEGISLDVLTARNASAVGYDSGLLGDIPAEVRIHRTITLDLPFGIKKRVKKLITGGKSPARNVAANASPHKPNFLERAIHHFMLPDPQVSWLLPLTRAARQIIRTGNIDLVLVTVPPFSTVLVVEKLRKEFPDLPIVVDFRDEWLSTTINLVSFSRSDRAFQIARHAEASTVKNASAVVAVTEAARRAMHARYPEQPESKFQLIPNGFDASRLRRAASSPNKAPGAKIVASYVGTVYSSTDPTTLVEAVQSLPAEIKSKFKLRFIGHIEEPRFRQALLGLGDIVELKGFLPQSEALALMNETDYALLITHDPLNVAAKFYDYVGSGKPILAAVHPQGDVRRLLEELRAGWWADSSNVESIRKLFIDAAARGDSLPKVFQPDRAGIAQYERKVLAQRYATLLCSIAGRPREADHQSPQGELAHEASYRISRNSVDRHRTQQGVFPQEKTTFRRPQKGASNREML